MAVNTPVELHGVVVTAVDSFGDRQTAFFIEEPGGGPFSGVQVFVNSKQVADGLLATIHVGDLIDLTGAVKTEFVLTDKATGKPTDTSGRTTTELQSAQGGMLTVVHKGTGTVPEPHLLDAAALDAMPMKDRDAELEKWEGVLVSVQNVRARTMPFSFASGNPPVADDSFKVNISDNIILESTQVKFTGVDGLSCYDKITGVEDYFFDWLLLPRNASDLPAATGTGCAAVPQPGSTITAIQTAIAPPTTAVTLSDVYVTGLSFSKTSMWVSTSPTAAINEGVFVFQSSKGTLLDPAIKLGSKVTVVGTVSEFNDDTTGGTLTEVAPLRITLSADAPVPLVPVADQTVATLLTAATSTPYESVLVTLNNVNITALGTSDNGSIATAVQDAKSFAVGTDIVRLTAADLGCYDTVTGFWTNLEVAGVTTKPNTLGFIIRDHGAKGTNCKLTLP